MSVFKMLGKRAALTAMTANDIDVDEVKLCPVCVEGLLSKSPDFPDQVVYVCATCGTNFTPALLHEIVETERKIIQAEAKKRAERYSKVSTLAFIVFTIVVIAATIYILI